jgi:hypothetical protein
MLLTWRLFTECVGEFVAGRYEGHGILIEPNKDRFDGFFKEGQKHGTGLFWSVREQKLYLEQWNHGTLISHTPGTQLHSNTFTYLKHTTLQ